MDRVVNGVDRVDGVDRANGADRVDGADRVLYRLRPGPGGSIAQGP